MSRANRSRRSGKPKGAQCALPASLLSAASGVRAPGRLFARDLGRELHHPSRALRDMGGSLPNLGASARELGGTFSDLGRTSYNRLYPTIGS